MKIVPLSGRVIVKEDASPDRRGPIHLPANIDRGSYRTGLVTHVAEDEPSLKPGDRVLYPHHRGQHHTIDGDELLGLLREDVLAVLR